MDSPNDQARQLLLVLALAGFAAAALVAWSWAQPTAPTLVDWMRAHGSGYSTEWETNLGSGYTLVSGVFHPEIPVTDCRLPSGAAYLPRDPSADPKALPPCATFELRYGITPDRPFNSYSVNTAGQHAAREVAAYPAIAQLGIAPSAGAPWNPAYDLNAFDLSMVSHASERLIAAAGFDDPNAPVAQPTAVPTPVSAPTPQPTLSPSPSPTPVVPPCPTPTPSPTPCPTCTPATRVVVPQECIDIFGVLSQRLWRIGHITRAEVATCATWLHGVASGPVYAATSSGISGAQCLEVTP